MADLLGPAKMKISKSWLILMVMILVGWVLRAWWVWGGGLSFHYDMARDAFEAMAIWRDFDLKLIGPPTSIPGLYHGVLYYYLIAPLYWFGQGDPRIVAIALALLSTTTAIPIYLVSRGLFKDQRWGLVSAGLFIISFEAVQYGPWLSNPNPSVWSVAWFFYFLYRWYRGLSWGLVGAVVMATVSTHFQFFLIYLLGLLVAAKFVFRLSVNLKEILIAIIGGLLVLSSFGVSALKYQSWIEATQGFDRLTADNHGWGQLIYSRITNYFDRLIEIFTNNFVPQFRWLGLIVAIAVFVINWRSSFILFILLSSIPIFIFGGHSNTYVNVGMILPVMVGVTGLLRWLWLKWPRVAIAVIVLSVMLNLMMVSQISPGGQRILVISDGMLLKDQLALIDRSYQIAAGQPFSFNSLSVPLWTNTTWAYLYQWYGLKKYGYLPTFYGAAQDNQLGQNVFAYKTVPHPLAFMIIEDLTEIPEYFYLLVMDGESYKTTFVSEHRFGNLILQQRIRDHDEVF